MSLWRTVWRRNNRTRKSVDIISFHHLSGSCRRYHRLTGLPRSMSLPACVNGNTVIIFRYEIPCYYMQDESFIVQYVLYGQNLVAKSGWRFSKREDRRFFLFELSWSQQAFIIYYIPRHHRQKYHITRS
jgi:hypothetical protein